MAALSRQVQRRAVRRIGVALGAVDNAMEGLTGVGVDASSSYDNRE
jgi:hypothetical protein